MLNASPKLSNFLRKSSKKRAVNAFPMGFWWSLKLQGTKRAWFMLKLRHACEQNTDGHWILWPLLLLMQAAGVHFKSPLVSPVYTPLSKTWLKVALSRCLSTSQLRFTRRQFKRPTLLGDTFCPVVLCLRKRGISMNTAGLLWKPIGKQHMQNFRLTIRGLCLGDIFIHFDPAVLKRLDNVSLKSSSNYTYDLLVVSFSW